MMTLRPDSSRFFRISSVSLLPNLCRHRNNFFLTLPWAWQRPLKRSNSMANRGYPLPVQVRSYRSSRRRSKAARDFRRVSMIVPQLSANDTFDLGEGRSEEHTSELQSLMRISYAVFCLNKKIKQTLK